MDPRTRVLLEAPIASTLLRLAIPNMLVMLAQAAAGLINWAAVAGGAWFGSLRWPWSTAGGSHAAAP